MYQNISRFLFGSACLVCNESSKPLDPWLCPDCRQKLERESSGITPLTEAFAFYTMGPVNRKLIHALKYGAMPGMAFYLLKRAGSALENFKAWLPSYKRLFFIPVPLHHARFRERGYNQTEKLAEALASFYGGRVLNLLKRKSFMVSQTKLSKEERKLNVAGAFELKKKFKEEPRDLFIVVDDVFTTGATTSACLYALKNGGFSHVRICAMLYEKQISARLDYVADTNYDWE